MNESISKQLTDPHKNKEQFVHEMTEVYLLLENEFNHLALSGAVYKDELDIPDMSTVQLKNSENPIKTMMAPLSIEDGAEIHLSSLKIEKNNIEPSSVEFSATQKFSCPSFSLILPDNNQELSTDVPEVSIIVKNSDDCIGKVNTNLSYVETGTFKYRAKRLTDIVPEKISLNKFSIIKDIIGDKHTYSQDCELSPLVCPTNIIEIKFSCKNENIDVDVLNSCKIFNIDVPLSTLKKTFGMFPLVMNYTPVKIIGAPDIIGFFSSNSIKKRRVIENTSISLSSAFIQIPSEYFPELCMRDSQETEVQNTAIMVPESKVDISFGKTVGQKYKPVSIGMLNVSSELIELKAISTKNFEFPHIDLNLTTNSGVVPTISKIRTITCKQELMFDGNKVNSINIHNNVLVRDIDTLKIYSETIIEESVNFNVETTPYSMNIRSVAMTPLTACKKVINIPIPANHIINIDSAPVAIPEKNISVGVFAEKFPIHIKQLSIPYTEVTMKKKQTAYIEVAMDGMRDMTKYIAKSSEVLKKVFADTSMSTKKSAIDTDINQSDINISLPDIDVYSQKILNSLQRQIYGA